MMFQGKISRYVDAKIFYGCCALKFEAVDEVVIALLVFICYGDELALGWVKMHLPVHLPRLEPIQVGLRFLGIFRPRHAPV